MRHSGAQRRFQPFGVRRRQRGRRRRGRRRPTRFLRLVPLPEAPPFQEPVVQRPELPAFRSRARACRRARLAFPTARARAARKKASEKKSTPRPKP